MTRSELLTAVRVACESKRTASRLNTTFTRITTSAFYAKRPDSGLLIKVEVGSLHNSSTRFDILTATVLSAKQKIETHQFPFSLMQRELIHPDALDSPLHIWISPASGNTVREDWYTTKPVSLEPLVRELLNYFDMWHDLPQ